MAGNAPVIREIKPTWVLVRTYLESCRCRKTVCEDLERGDTLSPYLILKLRLSGAAQEDRVSLWATQDDQIAHTICGRHQGSLCTRTAQQTGKEQLGRGSWWAVESSVGRVAQGFLLVGWM